MATATLPAVRGYAPPSRQELADEIRQFAPAMHLYQGSPEWLLIEVHGRTVCLPPDVGGDLVEHPKEPGKMVPGNGMLAVRDVYGILRDKRNFNRPTGIGLLEGQDAGSIVMFIVENYQERGVVWLRGDESDAPRKAASKKFYARYIKEWAEQQRAARSAFVANFQQRPENKGHVPPPPTPLQLRAQEILDSISLEGRGGDVHICQVCFGWEGTSWEKYARHMKAAHGRDEKPPQDETVENPGKARAIRGSDLAELESPAEGAGGTVEGSAPPTVLGSGLAMAATDPRAGGTAIDHESPAARRGQQTRRRQ